MLARDRPTYLLGDLNYDLLQPTKPGVSAYQQLLADLSLQQLVTAPTRPGPPPTLIDHLVSSRPELATSVRVIPCDISDHDLITARVSYARARPELETIHIRSTQTSQRREDEDRLSTTSTIPLLEIMSSTTIEEPCFLGLPTLNEGLSVT